MKRWAAAVSAATVVLAGCGSQGPVAAGKPSAAASHRVVPKPTHLTVTVAPWRLPYEIAREAVVTVGPGKVVVAGGMFPGDTSSARAFELTPATDVVKMLPNLAVDVHDVAAGFYDGDPTTYGGGNSSEQSVVQQLRGGRWRVVAQLPTTRSDLSVDVVDGTTYVLGGYDGTGVATQVLAQRGSAPLRPAGSLLVGVRYAATAVIGTSIYLFGGEVNGAELDVVQRYDTVTGRTSVVARLPVPLGHASAAVLGGRVLLMGGRVEPEVGTTAMWWFDPVTNGFKRAGNLPAPITDAGVAVSPDGLTAWLLGGEDPNVRDAVVKLSLS
jgi:hypothetical protein